jgi:hypothetical protein
MACAVMCAPVRPGATIRGPDADQLFLIIGPKCPVELGDRHAAAERNLFGRLLGCLHHCLITGQHYDEATAFPAATKQSRRAA